MSEHAADRLALTVSGDAEDQDLPARLDRFAAICRRRRGARVSRHRTGFVLSVDPARIESVGPVIEAAADAAGLRVVVDDLGAEIRPSGLDGWASGVWAAIGNAVDEDDVSRSRGETPSGDVFRYLRVVEHDGIHAVEDARPPRVDPVGGPPPDFGPTKFDDVDWHEGAAAQAGRPREHAFAHIGIYLAWLIRYDLHDPGWFQPEHVRAIKAGSMTGSDLADDIDWKLVSDVMTTEGSDFTTARYDQYMEEYDDLLGEDGVYRLAEDGELYARVAPKIDAIYEAWVAAGRPSPEPKDPSPLDEQFDAMLDAADIPWDEIAAGAAGPVAVQINVDGTYERMEHELPHAAPELEALVPVDVVDPPIAMSSVDATQWGSSLLNRALKNLGVRPRDVMVASGVGGNGERTIAVTVYRVPGASPDRLKEAFGEVIDRPRRASWSDRSVGGIRVSWAEGREGHEYFHVAYWVRDDVVLHVAGRPEDMERVIRGTG